MEFVTTSESRPVTACGNFNNSYEGNEDGEDN